MAEPFNANEFRRRQLGAGQGPQGQPPIPQPVAQPHPAPPQPMPAQYAPQPYQHPAQPQAQFAQPPHQHISPQSYGQAPQQPAPYAPPQAAAPEPATEKKSRFKRGAKKTKVKAAKAPREKRETSPFLVFATGMVAGVLLTIMGLRFVSNMTEAPIQDVAALAAPAETGTAADLTRVQEQLNATKGLTTPAKP